MKRLSVLLLKEIVDELNEKIKGNFISHITIVSSNDILLSFSFYKKEKLFISLNHNNPFISLCDTKENFSTLVNQTNDVLRKNIGGAYVVDVRQKENDRIVTFTLYKTNDLFEKETFYLVVELISHRSNLVLLDKDRKIIFATHYTNLEVTHPILKGLVYEELSPLDKIEEIKEDLEAFKKEAKNYLLEAKEQRRKDQYSHLFVNVKNRIKSLNKKIIILQESSKNANKELSYKDMGNLIYSAGGDIEIIKEYVNQNLLKDYDFELSMNENANRYFKKYKKAKSTISHNEIEIKKALEEIEYNQRIYNQLENGDDQDLDELKNLLNPQKGKKESKNNKKQKISPLYIQYHGTKIAFGKTDAQNDILTFEIAKPFYEYFHIANYHGAHVVILSDNPSDETRLVASEIALILSKKEDGDVWTTKIKNVRKGDKLGLVNLKSYTNIHLNKIRESTKDLLAEAKRY